MDGLDTVTFNSLVNISIEGSNDRTETGKATDLGDIDSSEEKEKRLAKDFESLIIAKLFDQMSRTTEGFGFEEDGAGKQIQGMFWMYLAQEVSNQGGFGFWKDIYQSFSGNESANDLMQLDTDI